VGPRRDRAGAVENTSLTVSIARPRGGTRSMNRHRFRHPSDPDHAIFSITTFDHFGFLARDLRFEPELRDLYGAVSATFASTPAPARKRECGIWVITSSGLFHYPGK